VTRPKAQPGLQVMLRWATCFLLMHSSQAGPDAARSYRQDGSAAIRARLRSPHAGSPDGLTPLIIPPLYCYYTFRRCLQRLPQQAVVVPQLRRLITRELGEAGRKAVRKRP
jgi:hypothetical protein